MLVRKLEPKEHQKVSKSEEVVEVPPSLEKKKFGYHGFMARDNPRTLGSKEIPQVGFRDQALYGLFSILSNFNERCKTKENEDY